MSLRKGFTLLELLVVVLIVGILASVATPQYLKTVDSSRITDGFGTMMMIGTAQQMCWLDNPSNKAVCPAEVYYKTMTPYLVTNKYIAQSNWAASSDVRKVFFGTSLNTSNSCTAKATAVTGAAVTVASCMVYPTPNSWGQLIGYVDDNNVCSIRKPNTTFTKAPVCP